MNSASDFAMIHAMMFAIDDYDELYLITDELANGIAL
jgi:hypothetical protein